MLYEKEQRPQIYDVVVIGGMAGMCTAMLTRIRMEDRS